MNVIMHICKPYICYKKSHFFQCVEQLKHKDASCGGKIYSIYWREQALLFQTVVAYPTSDPDSCCGVCHPLPVGILSFTRRAAEPATELFFFLPDCGSSFCEIVQTVWGCWETSLIICSYIDYFCYVRLKVEVSWIFQVDSHLLWFSCS